MIVYLNLVEHKYMVKSFASLVIFFSLSLTIIFEHNTESITQMIAGGQSDNHIMKYVCLLKNRMALHICKHKRIVLTLYPRQGIQQNPAQSDEAEDGGGNR